MEGEGCEHVFSASNDLASTIQHSTRFHHHQAIEQHFAFWNADKYAVLSTFLWNHYRAAAEAVHSLTAELNVLKMEFDITDGTFEKFHEQEQHYLGSLKELPVRNNLHIRYVHVLDELADKNCKWGLACEAANMALSDVLPGNLADMSTTLNKARVRVDTAYQ
ncbi:hypothetical protein J3R82DRAFT_5274 [Butyriboletus roseoflavus]|nr:hypothetical protein J3R82DRAFT_5274 [Butyriboletus roseoflavus]